MEQGETGVLAGFCALEGLDGSGTTTQAGLVCEALTREGRGCFATCEPTRGFVGRQIRHVLRGRYRAEAQTIALLFAADRTEHVVEIRAHLERGKPAVTDRYLFSSLAYQSLGCAFEYVAELNAGFPLPELVVFLDTPVEVCTQRLRERGHAELYESADIQERILENYERAFEHYGSAGIRIRRLDGTADPATLCREICALIRE